MDARERDYHVARIVAGTTRVRAGGRTYLVSAPSRTNRYVAAEVRREVWSEAMLEGVMTADEAADVLIGRGLWSGEDEDRMGSLEKDVEELKVGIFNHRHKAEARKAARTALGRARRELASLRSRRHALDHVTCEAVADSAMVRYLVGASLLNADGSPVWPDPEARWELPDVLLDESMDAALRARLDEPGIRELARTEPWGSIWAARKHAGGLLGVQAADLLEEQRTLVAWSALYEWAAGHPESPGEDAAADDDMLDGWLIVLRRRREAEEAGKLADTLTNSKIRNAHEVFMVVGEVARNMGVDEAEAARKVESLNDAVARNIKAQRAAALRRGRVVSEMDMPDTWQRFQMEMSRLEGQHIKGRR